MTVSDVKSLMTACPLVASVQASDGSPVDDPGTLLRLAQASLIEGVGLLRLKGSDAIRTIRDGTGRPSIGLIKRRYDGSEIYITPTACEVDEVLTAGAEIVAVDGTARPRPQGQELPDLIKRIHNGGALALADVDSVESAQFSVQAGADFVSTTLAGYTDARPACAGPDLELVRDMVNAAKAPVFAEGRFAHRWEVEAALRMGALGVIVGGALNDPAKLTRSLLPYAGLQIGSGTVGAVDIGGTWLRFAIFDADWKLGAIQRTPNPPTREERLGWICDRVKETGVTRVGVSTGGIVDPTTGVVWAAKEYLMHDHIGIEFSERTLGVPTHAFGDGHATAWAHANLPQYAGRAVFTLAIGTGVGAGFAYQGRLWAGRRGEYPRINDLYGPGGETYEDLLGGIHLTKDPTEEQRSKAIEALKACVRSIQTIYFPDDIVIGGGVGLSPWLAPHLQELGVSPSPIGPDAGIFGAAALSLFPSYV